MNKKQKKELIKATTGYVLLLATYSVMLVCGILNATTLN